MATARKFHSLERMPRRRESRSELELEDAVEKWLVGYMRRLQENALEPLIGGRVLESHWQRAFFYDDFYGNALRAEWTTTLVGAGSGVALQAAANGVVRMSAGTDGATGTADLHTGNAQIRADVVRFLCRAALFDTLNSQVRFGVRNSAGSEEATFQYTFSGTQWTTRTQAAGVLTSTNVTGPVDTAYHFFGIFAYPTRVRFFIDGAQVSEHTTNISSALTRVSLLSFNGAVPPTPANNRLDVDFAKVWEKRLNASNLEIEEKTLLLL